MATIKTSIQITDGMTPALRSMQRALNITLGAFEGLQTASGQAIDTLSIRAAQAELTKVSTQILQQERAIEKANEKQNKFNNSIKNGGSAADGLTSKLKGLAATVGAAFGVKAVIGMADDAVTTKARLNLINDGLQTTEELQQKIFQSSQRSRASYTDTATAVSKLGILAKDAFSSNDEMVMFAEQMNKQFKIGGSSMQEQTSAMYQLTQAMAAGKLQGDEFRSILENAPLLAQSLTKEMGLLPGELKQASADGLITSDVIKRAMFSAAEETNAKFAELPLTFGQLWTQIVNGAQNALMPLLLGIAQGAQFISENWSTLEPIFIGLAAALGIYSAATVVANTVTWLGVAANRALAKAMLSNPIGWIALAIGILIGVMYKWVKANGGVKVSLMVLENNALFAFDAMKIGAIWLVNKVLDAWDRLKLGTKVFGTGLSNIIGWTSVAVLKGIEAMVNGAIGLINFLINSVNKIPGVSIGTIEKVTFGTQAAIDEEAKRKARAEDLIAYRDELAANKTARDTELRDAAIKAMSDRNDRLVKIEEAKAKAAVENQEKPLKIPGMSEGIDNIDSNTKGIKDAVTMSGEDLKYLRDLAEQEIINRFTTADVKVEMGGVNNNVSSNMDLDGMVAYLGEKLTETLTTVAEGVPVGV